jgi:hypothetical protein
MEVFDDLISAIQEAVISAHETSEEQHVRMMDRFFDDETGEPVMLTINLPHIDPAQGEIQYQEVKVPKVCLVPFNSIKIKDIEVTAEVDLHNEMCILL